MVASMQIQAWNCMYNRLQSQFKQLCQNLEPYKMDQKICVEPHPHIFKGFRVIAYACNGQELPFTGIHTGG